MTISLTGRNKRHGFTLIEILLVLLVLGVISGLAVPNLSQMFSRFQLSHAANDMAYLMRYAQSRAVIQRLVCRFSLDKENNQYSIAQKDSSDDEDAPSDTNDSAAVFSKISGRLGRIFSIPSNIAVQAQNLTVQFYPDGTIDKDSFKLCSKNQCFVVSTKEKSGAVNVWEEESP